MVLLQFSLLEQLLGQKKRTACPGKFETNAAKLLIHQNVTFYLQNLKDQTQIFSSRFRIHQTVKQSLYLYEIKKSLDKPINFKVCKYYKNEELPSLDDKSLSLFLQNEVEKY